MSVEHKRSLYAFLTVAIVCGVIVVNAIRSDAVIGRLRTETSRIVAGATIAHDSAYDALHAVTSSETCVAGPPRPRRVGGVRAPHRAARHPAPPRTWSTRTWSPPRRTRRHRIMRRGPGSATHRDTGARTATTPSGPSGPSGTARATAPRHTGTRRPPETCSWAVVTVSTGSVRSSPMLVGPPRQERGRTTWRGPTAAQTGDLDATPGTTSPGSTAPGTGTARSTTEPASAAGRLGLSPRGRPARRRR